MTWSEAEYVDYLQSERRAYAWVMQHHGGMTPAAAMQDAMEFYPYEPADKPFRGLVFHDEAWHWAMQIVYGDRYMVEHPELAEPSPEYQALL
ncbi:hypothetical protein ACFW2Y_04765 [Streptomyces sp. NPDC058877]|uniref:hypothetical protein n=1 Tax=unclassified Streptomyces TaxID=2593676 RepID=UPI003693D7A1